MKLHIKSIVIATLTLAVILLAVKLYAASPNPPKPQVWTPGGVAQVPAPGAPTAARQHSPALHSKTAAAPSVS